ncbi:lytic transglycosylase domain-containing protein [Ruminiclostridium herbifermentans]|uniref:Lytic transglycosylase domain-containing protein n=1 Tax=Ruminiclostridium herbifermentans TaxID=2488810 RepID=A0A4U7JHP9_9FIRM|nr:lytic transglycosylase domain-containing protein [Ruminiclostridium herbifermentans]QNU67663.1 lytic transglycosylase domain-containing protein [Ruminiclostridium herbifermentans]
MKLDINAIFQQKIADINSRLSSMAPKLGSSEASSSDTSFQDYLSDAALLGLDSSSLGLNDSLYGDSSELSGNSVLNKYLEDLLDKSGDSKSSNILKAQKALANSTAYIPSDKTELMELINTAIDNASAKYGVDKNLIRAVMKQESSFNPTSISSSGAQGLMQLMPGTAASLGVTDPFDIVQNINGGVLYLRDQLSNFKGDISLALAAYNAGPNSVIKYDGIPPYAETQNYVKKVTEYYNQYQQLSTAQK